MDKKPAFWYRMYNERKKYVIEDYERLRNNWKEYLEELDKQDNEEIKQYLSESYSRIIKDEWESTNNRFLQSMNDPFTPGNRFNCGIFLDTVISCEVDFPSLENDFNFPILKSVKLERHCPSGMKYITDIENPLETLKYEELN